MLRLEIGVGLFKTSEIFDRQAVGKIVFRPGTRCYSSKWTSLSAILPHKIFVRRVFSLKNARHLRRFTTFFYLNFIWSYFLLEFILGVRFVSATFYFGQNVVKRKARARPDDVNHPLFSSKGRKWRRKCVNLIIMAVCRQRALTCTWTFHSFWCGNVAADGLWAFE